MIPLDEDSLSIKDTFTREFVVVAFPFIREKSIFAAISPCVYVSVTIEVNSGVVYSLKG